jgi:hypothetical protein
MTNNEIINRNRAIAEFMGYKYFPWNSPEHQLKGLGGYWAKKNDKRHSLKINVLHCSSGKLQYNSSWSWLMPVVEKMEREIRYNDYLGYDRPIGISISEFHCSIILPNPDEGFDYKEGWYNDEKFHTAQKGNTKIEAVFLAVSDYCLSLKDKHKNILEEQGGK